MSPTHSTSLLWAQEPLTRSAILGLSPVSLPPVTITPRCVPGLLISSTKVVPQLSSQRLVLEPRLEELRLLVGTLELPLDSDLAQLPLLLSRLSPGDSRLRQNFITSSVTSPLSLVLSESVHLTLSNLEQCITFYLWDWNVKQRWRCIPGSWNYQCDPDKVIFMSLRLLSDSHLTSPQQRRRSKGWISAALKLSDWEIMLQPSYITL